MRPPTYHDVERNRVGAFLKSCRECVHDRQFKGVPVCLKYHAQVRLNKTCDDWDGGPKTAHNLEEGFYFVVSKERVGFVWQNEGGSLQCLPGSAVLQTYERAELNLPCGKLSEMGNWAPDFKITGRTRRWLNDGMATV
jgi:hypothetical protein